MKTFASPDASPTSEAATVPSYSGELPSVADAITIFRAVTGQYDELAEQFGASLMTRLVAYAESDMLGAIQAGDEPHVRSNLRDHFPGTAFQDIGDLRAAHTGERAIDSTGAMEDVFGGLSHGYEMAVDTLCVDRYSRSRARLPLYWFLPVRRAIALQAENGTPDDSLSAVELQQRIAPSEHVLQIASALGDLGTPGR